MSTDVLQPTAAVSGREAVGAFPSRDITSLQRHTKALLTCLAAAEVSYLTSRGNPEMQDGHKTLCRVAICLVLDIHLSKVLGSLLVCELLV